MRSLRVLDPGLQTTVQDRGRVGYESLGVPRGGALDFAAFRWANRLAGNRDDLAALESLLHGPTFVLLDDLWVGVTGGTRVTVDGKAYPPWSGFWAASGSTVRIEGLAGARSYLAVHGGIAVEPVLGSHSTDIASGFGGYHGRAVRAGDELPVGASVVPSPEPQEVLRCPSPVVHASPLRVRVVPGPHPERLAPDALSALMEGVFTVSPRSDGMGIRLAGGSVPAATGSELSEPMPVGGVQITPAGQPIVLMNGRGTIGGYPVVAVVVTPDIWRLGQARPGDEVRFETVSLAAARAVAVESLARLEQAAPLRSILRAGSEVGP